MIDLVLGAQRGDEGKGNFCAYLGLHGDYSLAVRSVAPQAGHSIHINGKRVGLSHIPCAVVNPEIRLLLGCASFIEPKKLFYGGTDIRPYDGTEIIIIPEIGALNLDPGRLGIDKRAKLVLQKHIDIERNEPRFRELGSVLSGINGAKLELILKRANFVTEDPELNKFTTDTIEEMYNALESSKNILYETDHGMELCQHLGVFPHTTARTINTSAYLGEIGIAPHWLRDTYLAIKPYVSVCAVGAPIKEKVEDKQVLEELGARGGEKGTISGRTRLIGKFDSESFVEKMRTSGATRITISHLDLSRRTWQVLGFNGEGEFLRHIRSLAELAYNKPPISLVSRGPRIEDVSRMN